MRSGGTSFKVGWEVERFVACVIIDVLLGNGGVSVEARSYGMTRIFGLAFVLLGLKSLFVNGRCHPVLLMFLLNDITFSFLLIDDNLGLCEELGD